MMGVPQQILTVASPQSKMVRQHLSTNVSLDLAASVAGQASAATGSMELEHTSVSHSPVVQGQSLVQFANNKQGLAPNALPLPSVPQQVSSTQQSQQIVRQVPQQMASMQQQSPQQIPQQVVSIQQPPQQLVSMQQPLPQQVSQQVASMQQHRPPQHPTSMQQQPQLVASVQQHLPQQISQLVASMQQLPSQQIPQQMMAMQQLPQQVPQQVASVKKPQQVMSVQQLQQVAVMQQFQQVPQQLGSVHQSPQVSQRVSTLQQPQQVVSMHQISAIAQLPQCQHYPGMPRDTFMQPSLVQQEQQAIQIHHSTDQHPSVTQQMLYHVPHQQQKQEQFVLHTSSTEQLTAATYQDMEKQPQVELSGSATEQVAYPMQTQYQLQAQEQVMYSVQGSYQLQTSEQPQQVQPTNQLQAPEQIACQRHVAYTVKGLDQPSCSNQLAFTISRVYPGRPLDLPTYPVQPFFQGQSAYVTQPPSPYLAQCPEIQQARLAVQVKDQPSFALRSTEQRACTMQDGSAGCMEQQICLVQPVEVHAYPEQQQPELLTYLIQKDSGIGHQQLHPPPPPAAQRIAERQQLGMQAPFLSSHPSYIPQMQPRLPYQNISQQPLSQVQAFSSAHPLKATIPHSLPNILQTASSVPDQPEQAYALQHLSELPGFAHDVCLLQQSQTLQPADNHQPFTPPPVQPIYVQQQPICQASESVIQKQVPSNSSVPVPLNQQASLSEMTQPPQLHIQGQDIPQVCLLLF